MSDGRLNRTEKERKWNEEEKREQFVSKSIFPETDCQIPGFFIRVVYKDRHLLNHTAHRKID